MAQTLTALYFHLIWSTKNREPQITAECAGRLFEYLGGITKECDAIPILINGVVDHVHALVEAPPTVCVSDFMRVLKANSSKWVHETFPKAAFAWQTGYAAFSVSRSNVPAVKDYIVAQEEHHHRVSFQEELIKFLQAHGVEYDARYIWT